MAETLFPVFDAACTVGRHLKLQANGPHSTSDLIADLDHYRVAQALVVDSMSREGHPEPGNQRVLAATAGQPRLVPAWSALPAHGDDEQEAPEAFVARMRAHRVGALFLYPQQYRFSLQDWCVDPFLAPLAAAGVPVFIDFNEVGRGGWGWDYTDWEAVVALCRRWPELPVVVTEYRIRQAQRMIYRALDTCPNLRLELSGLWLHRAIEYITAHWGAERLVFGSHWPHLGHHVTLTTLATADIEAADRDRIASGNLRQLISWCGPQPSPAVDWPDADDAYAAFGRSGQRPADMRFWDNHGHMGGRAPHYHLSGCSTVDGIVRDMDRLGVQQTCIFSFDGVFSDEQRGNDTVAEAVRRYPDRFVGFTLLNPHRGAEAMQAELERGAAMGLRGVKLIPYYQDYPEEGPLIDLACQWAHAHQQIILNHHWGSPAQVERLVATYPNACFFTGHTTTAYADIMRRHANLYVCSCPLCGTRTCEEVVAAIGADRLMFGSDLQDLPIAWGLGPILFARLPEADKRLILGGNLQRVLATHSRPA